MRCNWNITRSASRRSPTICWILSAARKRWPSLIDSNRTKRLISLEEENGKSDRPCGTNFGGVVDVEFPAGCNCPKFLKRSKFPLDNGKPLVLEVQKHLGNNWVRTVAMDATDGLQRGRAGLCHRRADHGAGWPGHTGAHLQCAWAAGG